jgi:hypothetical protein
MIFGLKLSRSDISNPGRRSPTSDSFDSKNYRLCIFFFSLFPLSYTSLLCISRSCLTLPPVVRPRSAQRRPKMLPDPPPKQRNPMCGRLLSAFLLRSLQMRGKRSCLFRSILVTPQNFKFWNVTKIH